jgi:hypothetical protein
MDFEIVGDLVEVETIASGCGIRDLRRLRRNGKGYWKKMKGIARIDYRVAGFVWQNCTGMKRTASARKSSSARGSSTRSRKSMVRKHRFVVCVRNDGNEASLERNKIYEVVPDKTRNARANFESSTKAARITSSC